MTTAPPARPRWTWALALVLAVVGVVAVTVRPLAPPVVDAPFADELTRFPPDVLAMVDAWVGPIRVAFPLRLAATLGVPVLLVTTERGRRIVDRLAGRRLATLRGALVVVLVGAVAAAPITWWIGWRHAGAFGFRTSGPWRFVLEHVGGVLLEAGIVAVTVVLLLWLVRRRPHDWPAVGTVVGTALTGLLVLVQPLVVTTLLYDPQPLDDPEVAAAVEPILAASELPDTELLVGRASVRTTRVNAFVTGIGPSRQVVLWDTLLELPTDRVVAVVAHEVAHAEHDDLPRAVLASATAILVVLLLVRAALRTARRRTGGELPLSGARAGACAAATLVVLQLLAQPVVAFESRRVEAAADARALELARDPAAQVAVNRGFVVDDLADPTPPGWVRLLSTHPTTAQRIRAAAAFAAREGLAPRPGAP